MINNTTTFALGMSAGVLLMVLLPRLTCPPSGTTQVTPRVDTVVLHDTVYLDKVVTIKTPPRTTTKIDTLKEYVYTTIRDTLTIRDTILLPLYTHTYKDTIEQDTLNQTIKAYITENLTTIDPLPKRTLDVRLQSTYINTTTTINKVQPPKWSINAQYAPTSSQLSIGALRRLNNNISIGAGIHAHQTTDPYIQLQYSLQ